MLSFIPANFNSLGFFSSPVRKVDLPVPGCSGGVCRTSPPHPHGIDNFRFNGRKRSDFLHEPGGTIPTFKKFCFYHRKPWLRANYARRRRHCENVRGLSVWVAVFLPQRGKRRGIGFSSSSYPRICLCVCPWNNVAVTIQILFKVCDNLLQYEYLCRAEFQQRAFTGSNPYDIV
jgi:hypothetical protein